MVQDRLLLHVKKARILIIIFFFVIIIVIIIIIIVIAILQSYFYITYIYLFFLVFSHISGSSRAH